MSNTYTACVNLTKDPEDLTFGEREVVKLRCADNTFGRDTVARFFDAIVSGKDLEAARRLKSGDQIVISGQLTKTTYKAKKGKNKGKTIETDSMPFASIMQITKSPSFFGGADAEDASDEPVPSEEPDLTGDDGDDPLADLV